MDVGMSDVVVFMYTLAAVITGVFLERSFGGTHRVVVLSVAALAAAVWVVYYRFQIETRLERLAAEDEDDESVGEPVNEKL